MHPEPQERECVSRFDEIALELQELKASASVSYAELVRRITEQRVTRGVDPATAAPARSTVYDAFREGRVRVDVALVRDIVLALGATDEEADAWAARCRDAQRPLPVAPAPRPYATPHGGQQPRKPARQFLARAQLPRGFLIPFLLGCIILNYVGDITVRAVGLPVYLDMIGTATAAIVLGPWWGVGVALLSNLSTLPIAQGHTLLFSLVAVAGALSWGYGVRKFNMGRDFSRFFLLAIGTAVVCSIVAVPILVLQFGGGNGHAGDLIWGRFTDAGVPLIPAVFFSNITTSVMDKLLSSFIALALFAGLHARFGISADHLPLVGRLGVEPRTQGRSATLSSAWRGRAVSTQG